MGNSTSVEPVETENCSEETDTNQRFDNHARIQFVSGEETSSVGGSNATIEVETKIILRNDETNETACNVDRSTQSRKIVTLTPPDENDLIQYEPEDNISLPIYNETSLEGNKPNYNYAENISSQQDFKNNLDNENITRSIHDVEEISIPNSSYDKCIDEEINITNDCTANDANNTNEENKFRLPVQPDMLESSCIGSLLSHSNFLSFNINIEERSGSSDNICSPQNLDVYRNLRKMCPVEAVHIPFKSESKQIISKEKIT